MAPTVTAKFVADVKKYYRDQKPYNEKLKEALKQEPIHYDKPKPRYADIQREQAQETLKPLAEFDWNFGVGVPDSMEELLKQLSKLKTEPNKDSDSKASTSGGGGKKGSKK